jgi:hypothetical protein
VTHLGNDDASVGGAGEGGLGLGGNVLQAPHLFLCRARRV